MGLLATKYVWNCKLTPQFYMFMWTSIPLHSVEQIPKHARMAVLVSQLIRVQLTVPSRHLACHTCCPSFHGLCHIRPHDKLFGERQIISFHSSDENEIMTGCCSSTTLTEGSSADSSQPLRLLWATQESVNASVIWGDLSKHESYWQATTYNFFRNIQHKN